MWRPIARPQQEVVKLISSICECVSTIVSLTVEYKQLTRLKADGSLGKVISNYLLPTIDSMLVHFNGCKLFTIGLRSGYYHIHLKKEAAEKAGFVTDKGKWIFHSLPFGINIGPSAFSYLLGRYWLNVQSLHSTI